MARALLAALLLALCFAATRAREIDEPIEASDDPLRRALGARADAVEFARAIAPRPFEFPRDHGAHPDYRTEWWYFTGNLATDEGRRFGYQLTFFRIALAPSVAASPSAWRARQIYMAHFALSDIEAGEFYGFERFGRGALGLAGVSNPPLSVWVDHWRARADADPPLSLRLAAEQSGIAIDLTLAPGKPIVAQGDDGLSRKSAEPGNASYYYSAPRMPTAGRITIGDRGFDVAGTSWLDREWSTSALAPDQIGWDWFALQLGDGRELMYYRLRRQDGGADRHSAGTLIGVDGTPVRLAADDVRIEVDDHWRSPASGVRYPSAWRVALPGHALELRITPALENQELNLTVRYWEGAVTVRGTAAGRPLGGVGYVELAGYR
jgi:predicted secreted hydrolase